MAYKQIRHAVLPFSPYRVDIHAQPCFCLASYSNSGNWKSFVE